MRMLRRGRRVAGLIDAEDLAALILAAEDLDDLRAADAARAEMAETGVPAEQVVASAAEQASALTGFVQGRGTVARGRLIHFRPAEEVSLRSEN
jgi:hypothetical protein